MPPTATLGAAPRAFLRAELLQRLTERQFRTALARGDLVRMLPGIYAAAAHADDFTVRCQAALLWAAGRAVLGGTSAVHLHNLTAVAPSTMTLVAPSDVRLRPPPWIVVLQPSVAMARITVRRLAAAGIRTRSSRRGDNSLATRERP